MWQCVCPQHLRQRPARPFALRVVTASLVLPALLLAGFPFLALSGEKPTLIRLADLPANRNSVRVNALTFSPDGRTLAAGVGDSAILWEVATGRGRANLGPSKYGLGAVAFTPDGRGLLAANTPRAKVTLWDLPTGKPGVELLGSGGGITCWAFRPHGKTMACGDEDGTVRLWNRAKGTALGSLSGTKPKGYQTFALAFSPDGKTLAVGGGSRGGALASWGEVGLWDVAERKLRHTLRDFRAVFIRIAHKPARILIGGCSLFRGEPPCDLIPLICANGSFPPWSAAKAPCANWRISSW